MKEQVSGQFIEPGQPYEPQSILTMKSQAVKGLMMSNSSEFKADIAKITKKGMAMPMSAQVSRQNSPRDSSLEKEGQAETIRKKVNEDVGQSTGKKKIVKKIIKKKNQADG